MSLCSNNKHVGGVMLKEEGNFTEAGWQRERILNGDELMMNRLGVEPSIQRIKLYEY